MKNNNFAVILVFSVSLLLLPMTSSLAFEASEAYFLDGSQNVSEQENSGILTEQAVLDPFRFEPVVSTVYLHQQAIEKGLTISSEDKKFLVGIKSNILEAPTDIVIKHFDRRIFEFPQGLNAVTDVYEFDVRNPQSFNKDKPLIMQFVLDSEILNQKRLYFYNGIKNTWDLLPSWTQDEKLVRAFFHLPYAKLVVLENDVMEIGDASWYAYKGCDCAASPDYPKGTLLKVTDLDTQKSVIVKVNDFGPDRAVHPERVIDLDKVAFAKLGKLSCGILSRIKVEEVK